MHSIVTVVVFSALATTALVIGPYVWGEVIRRRRAGQPIIEYAPRRPAPWSIVELAAAIGAFFALTIAAVYLTVAPGDGKESVAEMLNPRSLLATAAASTLATAFAAVLVTLANRATPEDLGLSTVNLAGDITLGAAAFAAIIGPVYMIQALLGLLTDTRHPIIELLQQRREPIFFIAAGISAVVVAPIAEEFFFRVLLQGWLEKVWPRPSTLVIDVPPVDGEMTTPVEVTPPTWGPIIVSAAIFALAHLGHGPDPIPLFFLALVLGYLYARTHRIWPGLVLHLLINGCSLLMLWLGVGS